MNDCLRTNVFVRFSPETIACACIFLSARQLKVCSYSVLEIETVILFFHSQIPLPQKPAWWTVFDTDNEAIEVG